MRLQTALTSAIASTVLIGCGGSSGSSGDKAESLYNGTWLSPSCRYGEYFPDTDSSTYERDVLTINDGSFVFEENTYSDASCTLLISSDRQELSLTLGETFTGADTGLTLQQLAVSNGTTETHYSGYATANGNHLIVTSNDANTYPDHITLDEYYVKQDGDFTPDGATITVLGHSGMNLSDGIVYPLEDTHDVATIGWSPTGTYDAGVSWGDGVWLRANYESTEYSYVADMGANSLAQVTSLPTAWPTKDDFNTEADESSAAPALVKGHVYVVRMLDGNYAKIRILNTPDADGDWNVLIEYELM